MTEIPGHIFFFRQKEEYGWLSNFSRHAIALKGITWLTVEHYFQAKKCTNMNEAAEIHSLRTPTEAKLAGYHVNLRPDWEEVKEEVMLTGLRAKFSQHKKLREELLATGNRTLHEDSPWDKYWGYAKGFGQDRLGILLMLVREEMRAYD